MRTRHLPYERVSGQPLDTYSAGGHAGVSLRCGHLGPGALAATREPLTKGVLREASTHLVADLHRQLHERPGRHGRLRRASRHGRHTGRVAERAPVGRQRLHPAARDASDVGGDVERIGGAAAPLPVGNRPVHGRFPDLRAGTVGGRPGLEPLHPGRGRSDLPGRRRPHGLRPLPDRPRPSPGDRCLRGGLRSSDRPGTAHRGRPRATGGLARDLLGQRPGGPGGLAGLALGPRGRSGPGCRNSRRSSQEGRLAGHGPVCRYDRSAHPRASPGQHVGVGLACDRLPAGWLRGTVRCVLRRRETGCQPHGRRRYPHRTHLRRQRHGRVHHPGGPHRPDGLPVPVRAEYLPAHPGPDRPVLPALQRLRPHCRRHLRGSGPTARCQGEPAGDCAGRCRRLLPAHASARIEHLAGPHPRAGPGGCRHGGHGHDRQPAGGLLSRRGHCRNDLRVLRLCSSARHCHGGRGRGRELRACHPAGDDRLPGDQRPGSRVGPGAPHLPGGLRSGAARPGRLAHRDAGRHALSPGVTGPLHDGRGPHRQPGGRGRGDARRRDLPGSERARPARDGRGLAPVRLATMHLCGRTSCRAFEG